MADQIPGGDDWPTWAIALASIATTIAGAKAWGPIGRWIARRLDQERQWRANERGDIITQLNVELKSTREENVQLRQELGEERELRMTFAQDHAVLRRDVEHLTRALAEDKRDCQREIRRLNTEIRRLNGEVAELRSQHRGEEPRP